ncbi:hypothetical protein KC19_VG136500 [Ceratodon purpureus]|uniref:Uncharacterized protein n=1 Tax=Ceratodon purpureus TaxID=3225 RepID=A0A8T0HPW5_CERPU|nr:hypothetical protein KC19_VG136500 [Ceratodon purpureus]
MQRDATAPNILHQDLVWWHGRRTKSVCFVSGHRKQLTRPCTTWKLGVRLKLDSEIAAIPSRCHEPGGCEGVCSPLGR